MAASQQDVFTVGSCGMGSAAIPTVPCIGLNLALNLVEYEISNILLRSKNCIKYIINKTTCVLGLMVLKMYS